MVARCFVLALLMLLPLISFAEDGYNASDVAQLRSFFELKDSRGVTNGSKLWEGYDPDNPETWERVTWENGRVTRLEVAASNDTPAEDRPVGSLVLDSLPSLTRVGINYTNITTVKLSNCPALESVTIKFTPIADYSFPNCKALISLTIDDCGITEFDTAPYAKLRYLNLSNNSCTQIDLSKMTSLNQLKLDNNLLAELDLSGLYTLETFWCENNPLTSLECKNLYRLQYLYIENCELSQIIITGCKVLEHLYADSNILSSIVFPAADENNIRVVSVNENRLASFDARKLVQLRQLYASDNGMVSIDLSKCSKLYTLELANNRFTSLDLSKLTRMATLNMRGNPLQSLKVYPKDYGYGLLEFFGEEHSTFDILVYDYGQSSIWVSCKTQAEFGYNTRLEDENGVEYKCTQFMNDDEMHKNNIKDDKGHKLFIRSVFVEECLQACNTLRSFFELKDTNGVTNAYKIFGDSYDSTQPESWSCCSWSDSWLISLDLSSPEDCPADKRLVGSLH